MESQQPTRKQSPRRGTVMGIGIAVVVAIGAAIGAAVHNVAMGVAFGVAAGALIYWNGKRFVWVQQGD